MYIYYTYILLDPRKPQYILEDGTILSGEPFYIGKGSGQRAYSHLKTNARDKNHIKIKKINRIRNDGYEPIVYFIKENLSEAASLELEKILIKEIGTKWHIGGVKSGPLTNMTSGGDGVTLSEEVKRKCAQYGPANGMYGKTHTLEAKKAMSFLGKKYKKETISKMRTDRSNGKNYNTMKWIVMTPDGQELKVSWLHGFCNENGITYSTLYKTLVRGTPVNRGPSKGYMLKLDDNLALA